MDNAEYNRAKERALYILEARDHSYAELYAKLEKNYCEEVCYAVCDKMTELGLIDDERYAQKLAKYLFTVKKFGKYRAVQEMRRRGIDAETIAAVSEEYVTETREILAELVERKYLRYLSDEKGVNKVKNALVRMGYSYDDINAVVGEFTE